MPSPLSLEPPATVDCKADLYPRSTWNQKCNVLSGATRWVAKRSPLGPEFPMEPLTKQIALPRRTARNSYENALRNPGYTERSKFGVGQTLLPLLGENLSP